MRDRAFQWMCGTLRCAVTIAAFVAVSLTGCSPEDPFIPTRNNVVPEKNGAYLRVIHAAADGPDVRVWVDSTVLFNGAIQKYMYFATGVNDAKYYPVDSAAATVSFVDASGRTVATTPVSFRRNGYYTAYLHGRGSDLDALVTTDTVDAPDRNDPLPAKIRLVNLVPDAPSISLHFGSPTATPLLSGVVYQSASPYARLAAIDPGTTPLYVTNATTGEELLYLPDGYVFVPAGVTFTLVLSGLGHPMGSERFLMSAIFNESALDAVDSLRGYSPFRYSFGALRLVNLAPGDSMLDVTFYDPSAEFAANDNYRRTIYGRRRGTLDFVHTLGHPALPFSRDDSYFGEYFIVGYNIGKQLRARIEYSQPWRPDEIGKPGGGAFPDYRRQDVYAADTSFLYEESRHYTIVAYGPYVDPTSPPPGRCQILRDDTPVPPPGMAQVRLFHGAFGPSYQGKALRLRIGGVEMTTGSRYGAHPPPNSSISVSAGTPTVEVLDEQGAVIYSQDLTNTPLEAGKSYTVFLSRGVDGASLLLFALTEDFIAVN